MAQLNKRQLWTITKLKPQPAPILLFAAPETTPENNRMQQHITHERHSYF